MIRGMTPRVAADCSQICWHRSRVDPAGSLEPACLSCLQFRVPHGLKYVLHPADSVDSMYG